MNHSSLPEIFRKEQREPLTSRKQGGHFSLHLTSQSAEKYQPSRAGYAPGDQLASSRNAPKRRATSTASARPKHSILRDEGHSKPSTSRQRMTVAFKNELEFWTGGPLRDKVALSVLNVSNFPYETSRKSNNMMVDLEEGNSIKNNMDFSLKEMRIATETMQRTREETQAIRGDFQCLVEGLVQDLDEFEFYFRQQLGATYDNLSKMRRETSKDLKRNCSQADKVVAQFQVCSLFLRDLAKQTKKLHDQTLATTEEDNSSRIGSPYLDFQGISSVPRSSRGATGEMTRHTKIVEMVAKDEYEGRSADWNQQLPVHGGGVTLNGKEVDLLQFEDC